MNTYHMCPNCKALLPAGSAFCPKCGLRITASDDLNRQTDRILPSEPYAYLRKGTILHGKYRINRVIGRGGFGITYDGTDLNLDMHIAVKEFFPSTIADRQSADTNIVTCSSSQRDLYQRGIMNFLKEAKNMAKFVGEENFVAVHDYFPENNTAYIIMEYVDGQNLRHYMKRMGRLSMDNAMAIVLPVMNALEKIHARGLVHRDISPSNIMILSDGRVKLLDFGAVRDTSLSTQDLTTMSSVYKLGYSPIEQQTWGMKQGTYSDIYALCATLYEMLTGFLPPSPFARLSGNETLAAPSSMGVRISPRQEKGLLKGLEIYGKDRMQTVRELRDALCIKDAIRTPAARDPLHDPKKRLAAVSAVAVVILSLLLVFILLRSFSGSKEKAAQGSAPATAESGSTIQETEGGVTPSVTEDMQAESDTGEKEETAQEPALGKAATESGSETQEMEESVTYTVSENMQAEPDTVETPGTEETETDKTVFPEGALAYGGHHYYIYNDGDISWEEAQANCRKRGGYLAVINNAGENETLFQYMIDRGFETVFFGLYLNGRNWEYLYGDSSDFTDWGTNSKGVDQPNNSGGDEINAALDIYMHSGYWNDIRFGRKDAYRADGHHYGDLHSYFCEWSE